LRKAHRWLEQWDATRTAGDSIKNALDCRLNLVDRFVKEGGNPSPEGVVSDQNASVEETLVTST
jgi:hypothetical protein